MGEQRKTREWMKVESLDLEKFNQEGLLEEYAQPGEDGKALRAEREEGYLKRKTQPTCLR